jgi:hypothetical protein
MAHDLGHVAQLLSGDLESRYGMAQTRYKNKWYRARHGIYKDTGIEWSMWWDPAGRRIRTKNLPWEKQVAKRATSILGRNYYRG